MSDEDLKNYFFLLGYIDFLENKIIDNSNYSYGYQLFTEYRINYLNDQEENKNE